MILNSPYVSGSLTVTGNITALGGISISGSIASASYASNAELLDGLDSSVFVLSSSFQNYSSSNDGKVAALNTFSASILSYTSSTDDKITQLNRETASLNLATASINNYTASNSANVANLFATSASLNAAVADIRNATASLYAATASLYNFSSSANLRIGSLEQYTQSLNTRSASFACVDSTNNFSCAQYFSNVSNAISFTSTGSLYSDGGMRITKDMYVSGTAYFNNVTVFGTQSINYITSSQLNIASNLITVNTSTPAVRFGGLAVYDSGSLGTGLTGSILWDSEANHWVYSNPSGSSYSGGMFISGPRSAALGSEQGTTACALMMGQGGDHITSSAIFHYGNTTCFYGTSTITSTGIGCFSGAICASSATLAGNLTLSSGGDRTININDTAGNSFQIQASSNVLYQSARTTGGSLAFRTNGTNDSKLTIDSAGAATFACSVGTTALNMNNMASLGSIGGGSIYLPHTAVIMFRTTDGATARAKITADNSNNLFLNSDGGNVGVGTASVPSDHILQIHSSCAYARMALTNTSTGVASGDGLIFQMENCFAIIKNQETNCLVLGTNGRETDIVIGTNGGVGIGQSPINKFTILAGNSNVLDLFDTGAGFGIGMQAMNSAATVYRSWDFYASKYQFFSGQAIFSCTVCVPSLVAGTANITINPNTYNWYSISDNSFKVLDFGKFGSVYSYQDGACYSGFANNAYFANSTFDWRYKNTAGASNLFFQNGAMFLETAGSGTANTAASLTTKLQVSTCGQLTMYSKTSPGALTVVSTAPSSQEFLTFYDNGQNGNCIVASMVDANGANAAGGLAFTVWRKSNAAGMRLISNNIIDNGAAGSEPVMNISAYSYCDAAMNIKTPSVSANHSAYAFNYNDTELIKIRANGVTCFANTVCAPKFIGGDFSTTTCSFSATSAGTNYDVALPGNSRWLVSVSTNAVYHWNGILALTTFDSADFGVNILTCGSYQTTAAVSVVNSGGSLRFCFSQNVGTVTLSYINIAG